MDLDGCLVCAAEFTKSKCVGVSGFFVGHVKWGWCLGDKTTDVQSGTLTL